MEKLRDLSRGAKLVLVAGPLLFVSLFFDWQTLRIDYGPAGVVEQPLDGWDAWGLLTGLLAIAAVTLVVLRHLTEKELREDVPWDTVTLGLGGAAFATTLVKSLTDENSTWESYAFVLIAGMLALGAYLSWTEERRESPDPREGRRVSSAA
ncbi:MAG TPA: hypothetical protein VI540_05385 [Gaiellaceae bacterium]|nr:hypothetical protein [Gaiellaceae bacterium]